MSVVREICSFPSALCQGVPAHAGVREANVILIESATSKEEQAVRSIRSQELAPTFVLHSHDHETPEERLLSELEHFRKQALQRIAQSIDEVVVQVVNSIVGPDRQVHSGEIRELVQRELRRCDRESPVRLRVATSDVRQVITDLPIIADSTLSQGDFVLEMLEDEATQQIPVKTSCTMRRMAS